MNTDYDLWAELYDEVYSFVDNDINFYTNKFKELGGKVLEIGCGTGRVTIPLLEAGADITAVDYSQKMLEQLESKIGSTNVSIEIVLQDVRRLHLENKYNLIIFPYRGFQSLLSVEDQINALTSIRDHLNFGGRLIIDLFLPSRDLFDQKPDIFYHLKDFENSDKMIKSLHHRSKFDHHNQLIHTHLSISESEDGRVTLKRYADFTLRYLYIDEARYLFKFCGFKIQEISADYNGTPYNRDSDETIWSLSLN
ncbi:MAG: hypothetical protein CL739_06495 [Chloroflexi bacterium]|nr:hypothetical protein [Chloroflexota bacterium]|tara:strand:+ start:12370 stop:13125 length:756 start_codon:yes stop_codon:yes gene_type:complete